MSDETLRAGHWHAERCTADDCNIPKIADHPHDGYAYDGCKCVCCVNIRALSATPAKVIDPGGDDAWWENAAAPAKAEGLTEADFLYAPERHHSERFGWDFMAQACRVCRGEIGPDVPNGWNGKGHRLDCPVRRLAATPARAEGLDELLDAVPVDALEELIRPQFDSWFAVEVRAWLDRYTTEYARLATGEPEPK